MQRRGNARIPKAIVESYLYLPSITLYSVQTVHDPRGSSPNHCLTRQSFCAWMYLCCWGFAFGQ